MVIKNSKFVDKDFPPDYNSLFNERNDFEEITWKRLEDIIPVGTNLIENVQPSDIVQGSVGDCWLLASLAAIAEKPELIKKLFLTPTVNEEGLYQIRLSVNGIEMNVTVDSFLPFNSDGKLYSARKSHGCVWPAIVEKASAKAAGNYERLNGGDCEEALRLFTGCPSATIDNKMDNEKFWKRLQKYSQKSHYLLTCGINTEEFHQKPTSLCTKNNLIYDHVYTVLEVREHELSGVRLVRLRNPWGKVEFSGAWSDGASDWTPETRAFYHQKDDPTDGVFWIGFDDFRKEFNLVSLCYTKDWEVARIKGKYEKPEEDNKPILAQSFKMVVPEDTKAFFGIHQVDERCAHSKPHIDSGALVVDTTTKKVVGMLDILYKRVTQNKINLKKGEYLVLPYSSGVQFGKDEKNKTRNFALVVHTTNQKVELNDLGVQPGLADKYFLSATQELAQTKMNSPENKLKINQLSTRDFTAVSLTVLPSEDGKSYPIIYYDPSLSDNIIPAPNSIQSMTKICLKFNPDGGTIVNKYSRVGDDAYNLNLQCRLLALATKKTE